MRVPDRVTARRDSGLEFKQPANLVVDWNALKLLRRRLAEAEAQFSRDCARLASPNLARG
jgi:hypothetical protein